MKSILSIVLCWGFASVVSAQCVKGNCFRGHGTYEWENGDFYEGMWKAGKPDGNGTFYFENGDNYVGRFSEGLKMAKVNIPGKMEIRMMEAGQKIR